MTVENQNEIADGVALTVYEPNGLAARSGDHLPFQEGEIAPRASAVFVHGGLHGSWQWLDSQTFLAGRGRQSVAVDWYNHGSSRVLPENEWVARGIDALSHEVGVGVARADGRPFLVGHSMGGMAALQFAAAHPDQVSALVLLAPVVPSRFAGEAIPLECDDKPWPVPPFEVARGMFFAEAVDEVAVAAYGQLQPESPRAVYQATRWTLDAPVERIKMPILIVAGESDPLTAYEPIASMAAALSAEFISLPGGHGITFEPSWLEVLSEIDSWVARVVDGQSVNSSIECR